jgi:hypothetical protein
MKTYRCLPLVLSCFSGFATGEEIKLMDFTLPVPEKFVEFAEEAREDRGRDVSEFFKMAGILIPQGGKVALDKSSGSLNVTLPRDEALRLIQVLNWCIVESPARFFRGVIERPDQATAETDAKKGIPIPQTFTGHAGISIHVENRSGDRITCLIVNNTDRPTWFSGWGLNSPAYRVQEWSGDRWTEHRIVWDCGVGLGTPKLPPNRACRFDLDLPKTATRVRIGIALLDDISIQQPHNSIWTAPVNQSSEQAAPSDGDKPSN